MKKRNFTLVELLVVIGILALLAGLIIPAVIGAKSKGRITQARADMTSLRTAFEGMYRDYGAMAKSSGTKYALGGHEFDVSSGCITIAESSATANYCDVIAELSDPGNSGLTVSLNKKKIKYLDPRPEYDPSKSPTNDANKENTWLDPWGNPYQIRINVDASEQIVDPSDTSKKLSGRIIFWSFGPDGKGSSAADNKDNVAGWKDGDWLD